MTDPIESAIVAEHNRQEDAFKRAHVCMDFCAGYSTSALEGVSLEKIVAALEMTTGMLESAAAQLRINGHFPVVNDGGCVDSNYALLTKLEKKE